MRRLSFYCWLFWVLAWGMALGPGGAGQAPATAAKPRQNPPEIAAAHPRPDGSDTDFSAEPLVIERIEQIYTMAADGTGSLKSSVIARVQSDAVVRQLGVVGVPFAANTQHVEFNYVRVRHPDGTVTETAIDQAIEMPMPVTQAAPFYSDLKQMQLPVRNLKVGDKLEWQATIKLFKAEAQGQFWNQQVFLTDGVVLSQVVELHLPKGVYIDVDHATSKPIQTTVGEERILRWEHSNTKPTMGKEADAERERKKKHVLTAEEELDEEQGKLPDIAWSTFKSWEEVGAWYRSLESDRAVPDAEVKAKVAELIKGKTTEEEKVRAIYGYVATQIHYIGVDFGIGRYQPHRAAEVLENQYGDCKDKHTLLAAMLTEMGLHPNAVLIGADVRFNEALPSPAAFNHVITTVEVNGQQVWLDSTSEVAPYRMLQQVIRDKKALVIPESGPAVVETTPAGLPFDSVERFEAEGTLDENGTANSRLTLTLRGDNELVFRGAFHAAQAGQYEEMIQRISQGMGFAGTTSHAEIGKAEDTAEPFKMSYDYKREKPGNDWDNLRIVPLLMPVSLPSVDEADPPVQSLRLGTPRVEHSSSSLKLPEGWTAVLPEAIHAKSSWANFDETYRFEKGVLYVDRKIEVFKKKVPVADWKSYKDWTGKAKLNNDQYVQLRRPVITNLPKMIAIPKLESAHEPGKSAESVAPTAVKADREDTAKLIQAAMAAMQRQDLVEAKSQLDAAKSQNDTQSRLWAAYASVDWVQHDLFAAMSDYEKEISLHPESYFVYEPLARLEVMTNKTKEARETVRKWAAFDPANPQPVVLLLRMLGSDADAAAAESEAEAAIARLPEERRKDDRLQLLLGRLQRAAGMKEKGEATLLAVMNSSQQQEVVSQAAYELAEMGVDLPLVESTARSALEKMAAESKSWTLEEDSNMLTEKTREIRSAWETLGWTLYREGKLENAEPYLRAAWRGELTLQMGRHLGELLFARGKKAEAISIYQEAVGSLPGYDMMGVRHGPGPEQKEAIERLETLRKKAGSAGAEAKTKNLQQLRTFQLGPAKGLNGTAWYRFLLSRNGVEQVKESDNKNFTGGDEQIEHGKFPEFVPPESDARLALTAILNCHAGICELTLVPQVSSNDIFSQDLRAVEF